MEPPNRRKPRRSLRSRRSKVNSIDELGNTTHTVYPQLKSRSGETDGLLDWYPTSNSPSEAYASDGVRDGERERYGDGDPRLIRSGERDGDRDGERDMYRGERDGEREGERDW